LAYQVSTLVSNVQKRVKDTNYTSTDIIGFLNDVQNDVSNEYDLKFFEKTQNYTLNIGTEDIGSLPSDFVRVINLAITTTGFQKRLDYIDYRELDLKYPDWSSAESGVPRFYYIYANAVYVFPKPDQAYTLRLRYTKRPVELVNDSDVPEIPAEFAEMFVYGASARVYETKDRFDKSAVFENKYLREVQKLVGRYSPRQTTQPFIMPINVSRR
jgi:hypothetical protein